LGAGEIAKPLTMCEGSGRLRRRLAEMFDDVLDMASQREEGEPKRDDERPRGELHEVSATKAPIFPK
jgi:hypothetical protein